MREPPRDVTEEALGLVAEGTEGADGEGDEAHAPGHGAVVTDGGEASGGVGGVADPVGVLAAAMRVAPATSRVLTSTTR